MSELIQIMREEDKPKVVCPHCNATMEVAPELFKGRISEILKSNCPYCNGEIFVAVLMLCHPSLEGVSQSVLQVMETLSGHHTILGGEREH